MKAVGVRENILKPASVKTLPSKIIPVNDKPVLTNVRSQAILKLYANFAFGSITIERLPF
jgi:hypothetical protein